MSLQISIDGRSLSVEKGQTLLRVARENGIDIPTLCDLPGLASHGSCRMCTVEIQGRSNMPTACTTLAEDGMVVQTDSPNVQALRTELLKLLLSEHPSCCLFCPEKSHCDECMVTLRKTGITTGCRSCPQDGQCQLQTLVDRFGLTEVGYPVRYRMLPVERYDPFFDRDYNLCVLCGRCVRVCEEDHFSSVLTLTSRGTDTVVGTAFGQTHLQAGCSFCGACLEVCPTGTLSEKTRKWDGKPEREVATTCPLCSAGCQLNLLVKNDMVIGSLPDHTGGSETLCVKGRFGITELVNHPTRLRQPLVMDKGGSLPVSWEQAIETAAEKIASCAPEKYGMVLSADCSNETLYVARKFVRDVVGSQHLRTSSTVLYGNGLQVLQQLYGLSQPLSVLSGADAILCLGFDGKYAQSIVDVKLHQAKKSGAKLITFNANEHSLSKAADEWLRPVPGEEADVLEMLVESLRAGKQQNHLSPLAAQAARIAHLLLESKRTVILLGSSLLTHSDNLFLLKMVERLIAQTAAELVMLPAPVNLAGAFRMGIIAPAATELQDLEVLHLLGEAVPADLPDQPFILYQNIYPPTRDIPAGLILPAAAFTEEDGTFLDHAGKVQNIHQAVPAPGSALPSWQILCRIAQKLGVPGFDYDNAAQIQAEFEKMTFSNAELAGAVPGILQSEPDVLQAGRGDDHSYMGFPLGTWVAGFRMLYPE
ncbi:MAG: 4Fe-4S dicluster domain-containing protein [Chloroflexi bacterium]|nr:MAG: 4Fe-4S dicluster domain-containing protein [Chloroflexota bacterium]